MKTIIIKKPEDLKKYEVSDGIHITGNCEIECSLWLEELPKSLLVDWYLYIKDGRSIKAGRSIEAGEAIKAGEAYWISAWLSITCKGTLSLWLNVFAWICAWKETTEEDKTITCKKLESWNVEYGILKEIWEEKHTIRIDWKEIELSEDSYNNLKDSLK